MAKALSRQRRTQVVGDTPVELSVNGRPYKLYLDARVTLLDALRDHMGLTGTKKGCDQGACGACTVHVNGRRVLSCLTLAAQCDDQEVTTIEGLATPEGPHPLQESFVRHDGFQCGFCTPGQIMSAVALIQEGRAGSDDDVREYMSGNLCRCGAYANIVAAIREVSAPTDGASAGKAPAGSSSAVSAAADGAPRGGSDASL